MLQSQRVCADLFYFKLLPVLNGLLGYWHLARPWVSRRRPSLWTPRLRAKTHGLHHSKLQCWPSSRLCWLIKPCLMRNGSGHACSLIHKPTTLVSFTEHPACSSLLKASQWQPLHWASSLLEASQWQPLHWASSLLEASVLGHRPSPLNVLGRTSKEQAVKRREVLAKLEEMTLGSEKIECHRCTLKMHCESSA